MFYRPLELIDKGYLPIVGYQSGYVSRKYNLSNVWAVPYDGRYGKGYECHLPSYRHCAAHVRLYLLDPEHITNAGFNIIIGYPKNYTVGDLLAYR